jgi:tetraacyldisaccharide 4'-kinase
MLAWLRRRLYRHGWWRVERLPVPIVVVGNLSVGGTGKTPLVIWLAQFLCRQGWHPGIIARGYGGRSRHWPVAVTGDSAAVDVGDEPVLLARRSGCPVWVGPDRAMAARALLAVQPQCNILLADDGLQHYALGRDLEICVIDGERRFGNGWCLPVGPLRERPERLRRVDLVVVNGPSRVPGEWSMALRLGTPRHLGEPSRQCPLTGFRGRPLVAVAGIGHPRRFFQALRAAGLDPVERPFPDHHRFTAADLAVAAGTALLMTEKDAVKCQDFAGVADLWYVPVEAELEAGFVRSLQALIARVRHGQEIAGDPRLPPVQGALVLRQECPGTDLPR